MQVDKAAKLFRQAGCVESDIRSALVSHLKHEELDIPVEEPQQVGYPPCSHPASFPYAVKFGMAKCGSLACNINVCAWNSSNTYAEVMGPVGICWCMAHTVVCSGCVCSLGLCMICILVYACYPFFNFAVLGL